MIECIFTLDYENYGDGTGSLFEQIYKPAEKLKDLFLKKSFRFVTFVEVAELEIIERKGTDPAIVIVKDQVRELYRNGFEIALHIHPQWYNARFDASSWQVDYMDYNLCILPASRIVQILDRSIAYLRKLINKPDYTPLSFRNNNWLFQPSQPLTTLLAEKGIKVDSSLFKGGFQHKLRLDYRKALDNGYYWKFSNDITVPDPNGVMIEIPTFTKMVFPWQLLDRKRLQLQQKASSYHTRPFIQDRLKDFLRIRYPLKLDFCRLTFNKLRSLMERLIREDTQDPETLKPIVLIGHTKDLVDFTTVENLLVYLEDNCISPSTFTQIYERYNLRDL